jgi:lipopolysaccharide exporter
MTFSIPARRLLAKISRALTVGLGEVTLALSRARKLREPGFLRNVLVVMSGTGFAQLLSFAFSPVLSRLYGPVDFGLYGSFVSVLGILSSAITLQYSESLMLPSSDQDAARLFIVSCASALILATAFSALCVLAPGLWLAVIKAPELKGWLWLVPFAAMVTGLNQTLTSWCARRKAFKRTASALVVRSMAAGCGQTGAGLAGYGGGGLIVTGMVADILSGIALWRWVLQSDGSILRRALRLADVKSAARDYKDFPLYTAPQNFFNAISLGIPVILLIHYYGMAIGGIYAFSVRVLQVPANFVLTSLRQVLFQKLSEVHNRGGNVSGFFKKCTLALFAVALLPAIVGFIFAPNVFAFVFGAKWITAGEYARWLILWFLPGFCNLPAVLLGRILRQQRKLLLLDLALLISRVTVLMVGGAHLSPMRTIAAFSLVGALFNVLLIGFVWWFLKVHFQSSVMMGAAEVGFPEQAGHTDRKTQTRE